MYAASCGHKHTVKLLLEKGANPNFHKGLWVSYFLLSYLSRCTELSVDPAHSQISRSETAGKNARERRQLEQNNKYVACTNERHRQTENGTRHPDISSEEWNFS